jgi:phosphoglycolate phosphatase
VTKYSESCAAIFDLDGTLLDTLASLAVAFNTALTEMNCPTHPVDDYRMIIGDGARVAAIRCLPEDQQDDAIIDECVRRFQKIYAGSWQETSPYPGINELIEELSICMPLAVLSNKDNRFTKQCVDYFFEGKFQLAVGAGYAGKVTHKPDPSGGVVIAEHLNLSPQQLWMIGDTATDMNTATACNMKGVGVLWGFRDQAELKAAGAKHIVATPPELRALLLNQN